MNVALLALMGVLGALYIWVVVSLPSLSLGSEEDLLVGRFIESICANCLRLVSLGKPFWTFLGSNEM